MNRIFVVFSVERYNPYTTRSIVGITDSLEAARRIASLNEDSYVQCIIESRDLITIHELNDKTPWRVTLWNIVDEVTVKREELSENAKHENKIIINDYDSYMVLVWANNKDEAIEEARRMMLNERSN